MPVDETRTPDILFRNGWSLYHWNGLSWKWVLCDPNGEKVAMTDWYGPTEIKLVKQWAYRKIRALDLPRHTR